MDNILNEINELKIKNLNLENRILNIENKNNENSVQKNFDNKNLYKKFKCDSFYTYFAHNLKQSEKGTQINLLLLIILLTIQFSSLFSVFFQVETLNQVDKTGKFTLDDQFALNPLTSQSIVMIIISVCFSNTYKIAKNLIIESQLLRNANSELNNLAKQIFIFMAGIRSTFFLLITLNLVWISIVGISDTIIDCLLNAAGMLIIIETDKILFENIVDEEIEIEIETEVYNKIHNKQKLMILMTLIGSSEHYFWHAFKQFEAGWSALISVTIQQIPLQILQASMNQWMSGSLRIMFFIVQTIIFAFMGLQFLNSFGQMPFIRIRFIITSVSILSITHILLFVKQCQIEDSQVINENKSNNETAKLNKTSKKLTESNSSSVNSINKNKDIPNKQLDKNNNIDDENEMNINVEYL